MNAGSSGPPGRPPDLDLWEAVKKTTTPLPVKKNRKPDRHNPVAAQSASRAIHQARLDNGPVEASGKPAKSARPPAPLPVQADDKAIRRGKVQTQARIDLHGQTHDLARGFLLGQLQGLQNKCLRRVLVITGRGPGDQGVLRTALPRWLQQPDFAVLVSSYAQAHLRHGGRGAWYVFLRRPAKNP